jgi:hypothetical protein
MGSLLPVAPAETLNAATIFNHLPPNRCGEADRRYIGGAGGWLWQPRVGGHAGAL